MCSLYWVSLNVDVLPSQLLGSGHHLATLRSCSELLRCMTP